MRGDAGRTRPRLLAAALTALLVLMTAACSGDDAADTEVRPFTEVQGSDLVFANDPDFPGRGIFSVTTSEPMICAIVWGETEDLGNFNNSLAMNGTGIVQHDVFLPGAEAGGTYYYRVQGSTADGTLYTSGLDTFTLPESDAVAVGDSGDNLAIDAIVVDVSSEFNGSFAAANAFDGDLTTEWSTSGDGDEAWVTVDLGDVVDVGSVEFITRTMTDGTATATTFQVTVDDGEPSPALPAGTPADPARSDLVTSGQVFRFDIDTSTGGNTGAIEIRLFPPGT